MTNDQFKLKLRGALIGVAAVLVALRGAVAQRPDSIVLAMFLAAVGVGYLHLGIRKK